MSKEKLETDITDILKYHSLGWTMVPVFRENIQFFKKVLGEKIFKCFNTDVPKNMIDLTDITKKDISTLKEYLNYIKLRS